MARIQAQSIQKIFEATGYETEIKVITTKGDRVRNLPIDQVGKNGVFVGELERALVAKEVDVAIHSLKDMSSKIPEGFTLAPPPKAPRVEDVYVSKRANISRDDLNGHMVATGSNRRKAQLLHFFPRAKTVPVRGNIQTRIQKMEESEADGTILAYAGLERAALTDKISLVLDPREFIPSPCQGILGIEVSEARHDLIEVLEAAADPVTRFRMTIERKFQITLSASCQSPIGIYTEFTKDGVRLHGCYAKNVDSPLRFARVDTTIETALKDVVILAKQVKYE